MSIKTVIQQLFPSGNVRIDTRTAFEVHGLPSDTQPQNCMVLAQGKAPHAEGARVEYYLVRHGAAMLFFRICQDLESNPPQEFVIGRGFAVTPEGRKDLEPSARDWIAINCAPVPLTPVEHVQASANGTVAHAEPAALSA